MKSKNRTRKTIKHTACSIPHCDGNGNEHPTLGTCHACYQAVRYATMHGPTWVLKRQRTLAKFRARVESVTPSNVVAFAPKQRKAR